MELFSIRIRRTFQLVSTIEYDKSRLIEFDKKELKACILRFETELKILKDL